MTLNTAIYLDGAHGREVAREVYDFFNNLLGPRPGGEPTQMSKEAMPWSGPGVLNFGNELGQGLPAILDVEFREDAPVASTEQAAEHTEDCEWDVKQGSSCDWNHPVVCGILISLDTAYGYTDSYGGCSVLHARYIVDFYTNFVLPRGLSLRWKNEYSGEINEGIDGIEEFLDGGDEAAEWFTGIITKIVGN
jgi:hypothetical protein